MMKTKIIIGMSLMILLVGIVVVLEKGPDDSDPPNKYPTISLLEKEISWKEVTTFDPKHIISRPQFKVGEVYVYDVWLSNRDISSDRVIWLPYNYTTTINVDKIERINKDDYYVLREKNFSIHPAYMIKDNEGRWVVRTLEDPQNLGGCVIKVNKNNGSVLFNVSFNTICAVLEEMIVYGKYNIFLFIREDTKFIIGAEGIDNNKKVNRRDIMTFEVKGTEIINGKKCFRLEVERKFEIGDMMKKYEKSVYWVDVDKRIPVKIKKYEENILVTEINLIEIISSNNN